MNQVLHSLLPNQIEVNVNVFLIIRENVLQYQGMFHINFELVEQRMRAVAQLIPSFSDGVTSLGD